MSEFDPYPPHDEGKNPYDPQVVFVRDATGIEDRTAERRAFRRFATTFDTGQSNLGPYLWVSRYRIELVIGSVDNQARDRTDEYAIDVRRAR